MNVQSIESMTTRQRVSNLLHRRETDRLPMLEWAIWWDQTVNAWREQDAECPQNYRDLFSYFGLDHHVQFWISPQDGQLPRAPYHGAPVLADEEAFRENLHHLFPEKKLEELREQLRRVKAEHEAGDFTLWYTLEGFFWFPRTLFGIENHLYAFYDQEDLMLEMNERLADFYEKVIEVIYEEVTPEFMTFAEDMSYNHGPMLSKEMYDRFLLPFYQRLVPKITAHGTKVFIDTDGDVEPLIPWFLEADIQGVLPLERQAGVDVNRIRENYPDFLMIGGYDKTVMQHGEDAMRREFERILPAMRSGGYIPAVDHQTPPEVSVENYRIFIRLLREYTQLAVSDSALS